MAIPDFSVKTDSAILAAFQNASQQRLQQQQLDEQKKVNDFNQILQTSEAVGGLVSNMVQAAEKRKAAQLINDAKKITVDPTSTEAQRKEAQFNIANTLAPKELGQQAAQSLYPQNQSTRDPFPQQGSLEVKGANGKNQMVAATFRNGQYYYPNTDTLIPPESIVGKGYGLTPVVSGSGATNMVSRTSGSPLATVSSKDATIPEEKRGTVTELTGLEKNDRTRAFQMIDTAKDDPIIRSNRTALKTVQGLRKAIENNDKVAMDRMGGLMQKVIAQDSGNLAQWEQRDPNSRAALDRLQNWISFTVQGKPTEETKEMILATLSNMEGIAQSVTDDAFELHATSVTESFPQLNKAAVLRKMGKEVINKKSTQGITSIEAARKLTPEQRKARIQELLNQQGK